MTIPGINFYTAAGILSEIGAINRFENKHKFASYTGLIPGKYSSGERTVKGHITKHGPSLLRFFLVETVHSLIKFTKKFRFKYLSIVRRLGKKRSIVAIARILAETIYAMLYRSLFRELSLTILCHHCCLLLMIFLFLSHFPFP